jgi:inosose dehydratase
VAGPAARPPAPGLKIGLASYSLRKLSLEKALEVCKEADIKYLTIKEMHLPLGDPPEKLKAAVEQIKAAGVTLLGGGVIYMAPKDGAPVDAAFEASIRKIFEYAQVCGLPQIVAAPAPSTLDIVEKMVKEFNIPVAIHNHGPEDKLYPTPKDVLEQIKKRDKRIGVCMDIGHTFRAGADPSKTALECGPRLFDLHIKDIKEVTTKKEWVPVGRGVMPIVALLKTLQKMKYQGHVALEYEVNEENPIPSIRESLGYLHGVAAALGAA